MEELLKLAFPPENFGRVPRPVTPKPTTPRPAAEEGVETPAEGEDGAEVAEKAEGEEGEDAAGEDAAPAEAPLVVEALLPVTELDVIAMSTGDFPGGKPLVWLATYLKQRNKTKKRETAEANLERALNLAGRDAETLHEHYANVFEATRHLLWPCSAYISQKTRTSRELPRPQEPPKPEGEEGEAQPAEGEEEQESPPTPPVEYEEVEMLRYVATSHPMGSGAIEGWALEYQTQGVTGRVMDGEPVLVPDVAGEPGLHWFANKPSRLMGSYYALPLKDAQGAVWGVLSVDTLLDGRILSGADTEKLTAIAARANPVLIDVLAKLPPTPEPEPEEEASAQEGEGLPGDGEGEEPDA